MLTPTLVCRNELLNRRVLISKSDADNSKARMIKLLSANGFCQQSVLCLHLLFLLVHVCLVYKHVMRQGLKQHK